MESLLTPGPLARIMEEGERPNNMTVQVGDIGGHFVVCSFKIIARSLD